MFGWHDDNAGHLLNRGHVTSLDKSYGSTYSQAESVHMGVYHVQKYVCTQGTEDKTESREAQNWRFFCLRLRFGSNISIVTVSEGFNLLFK